MNSATKNAPRKVQILIFDGVEVLDFAGPFEVFSVAGEIHEGQYFQASLVALEERIYTAVNGLRVAPNATVHDAGMPDILVLPGGSGTREAIKDPDLLAWIQKAHESAELTLSICSGARFLAVLGLLDGLEATTHHGVMEDLARLAPAATLAPGKRFVDTGRIITTGGISAGIDGSFHLVERLAGTDVADATAHYMEYRRTVAPE